MIFNRETRSTNEVNINDWFNLYSEANGYEGLEGGQLSESTYFTCLKILSESIAKCNIQIKQETNLGEEIASGHYLTELLRLRPNSNMNAVDLLKAFVATSKHEGMAGIFINRKGKTQKVDSLYPVKITNITIDDVGLINSKKTNKILYDFRCGNEDGSCFENDIIILKDFTLDGIKTKSIRNIIAKSIDTSKKSTEYLNSLFENGLTNKIIVQLTSDIKEEKELKKVKDKFSRLYSSNGRIFTVPAGYNVDTLNLSLADAQFAELKKLSKEEIASVMGVPLSKLGIQTNTAKSLEQENLQFLVDTLQVIFTAIEQEMDYKLLTTQERKQGYKIRFNVNTILRMDSVTQAEVLNSYVRNGIYTLNTAKDILGIKQLEKDVTTFPSGQVTLEALLNGDVAWQKGGGNNE